MNRGPLRLCVEELEGRLVLSPVPYTDPNGAGYAVTAPTGTMVTDVKGSWVVPVVTKVSYYSYSDSPTWVGIDGFSSSSVEQIGTESYWSGGKANYDAWVEMYPAYYYVFNFTVNPGDSISAEVQAIGGNYFLLTLIDTPVSGATWTVLAVGNGSYSQASAEWIEEMPSTGNTFFPYYALADFGTVNFTGRRPPSAG